MWTYGKNNLSPPITPLIIDLFLIDMQTTIAADLL